jgi:2-phospho-L-lactate transferase/gluconeogenesis factor (CofD/UPF0052 family)
MKSNPVSSNVNVVIFCGGRGSSTLINDLLRRDNINLTLLINAYDDGLSTGVIRNYIPGMLGPSDFRKCMTYLLSLYSSSQYRLLDLLEYRLPKDIDENYLKSLKKWIASNNTETLPLSLKFNIEKIDIKVIRKIQILLRLIFDYIDQSGKQFDFRNCALGNLIFSGAYLKNENNFNRAIAELTSLVSTKAKMVNVSDGQNLILCALKSNGDFLKCEADIVNSQSEDRITNLFFLKKSLNKKELNEIASLAYAEKKNLLDKKSSKPRISLEADSAIKSADIVIYGPGTQHSSLYPSYIIASDALKKSKAKVKAMILNIGPDNDIKTFSCEDLIDRMLHYSADTKNSSNLITHALYNHSNQAKIDSPFFKSNLSSYKNIIIKRNSYENKYISNTHNGSLVISDVFDLWHKSFYKNNLPSLSVYLNFDDGRKKELNKIIYEILEIDWSKYFLIKINFFGTNKPEQFDINAFNVKFTYHEKIIFDEISFFENWITNKDNSDFIAIISGDGQYRFRDLALSINLLIETSFAAIYGSRTQNRRQNLQSLNSAYSENLVLFLLSFLGSFLLSLIMAIRTGIIFSDPLTGFRVFSKSKLNNLKYHKRKSYFFDLSYLILKQGFEIAEIPVAYKTYRGFVNSKSRFIKGLKSLGNSLT